MKIVPAILTSDKEEYMAQYNKLDLFDEIQVDLMDGLFVSNKSLSVDDVENPLNKFLEAHLMVKDPLQYFSSLKNKGFRRVVAHIEAVSDMDSFLKEAIKNNFEPVIAFNPNSKLKLIKGVKNYLKMTVIPGNQGQELDLNALEDALSFKKSNPSLNIGIDGGVNLDNVSKLLDLDYLCIGSYLTKSNNTFDAYKELVRKIEFERKSKRNQN